MRGRSSGTGPWGCSKTSGSRPGRGRSRTRWSTPRRSPSSAVETAPPRSRSSTSPMASTTSRRAAARASSCSSSVTSRAWPHCEELRMPPTDARKPLISGNWKMHLNHFEAIQAVQKLAYLLSKDDYDAVDVSVHPPFTDLRSVQTTIADQKRCEIQLGAQHSHHDEKGAFTGEISPVFLAKLDCTYVIAGHSERRELFGETDDMVNRKAKAILASGMTPIVGVGETLDERESGTTEEKVTGQVRAGLAGIAAGAVAGL